jgi:uncharacterized protein with PQ loop repeat
MTMLPPDCQVVGQARNSHSIGGFERTLRILSVVTMLMTVPQAFAVWFGPNASGVSMTSWVTYLISACLWFVYGVRKHDKTIYLACVGWIILDAAIVIGVIAHG